MDNNDFGYLFDEKLKNNIKNSFNDINFDQKLKCKIKEEALKKKSLKARVQDFLNYEVEIPIGRIGIIAALLAIIPTTFTLYEGKKIMDNNIKYKSDNISYNSTNNSSHKNS